MDVKNIVRYQNLHRCIISGQKKQCQELIWKMIAHGTDALEILKSGLIPPMEEVSRNFDRGICSVAEVVLAGEAVKSGMAIIQPLVSRKRFIRGLIVIGTVCGDHHDIGKDLLGIALESAGFAVHNLGQDVSAKRFAVAVAEIRPDILAMSCLLTTSRSKIVETIDLLQKYYLRDEVKVIIGGTAVTAAYATAIGADGYAPNASAAIKLCQTLLWNQICFENLS